MVTKNDIKFSFKNSMNSWLYLTFIDAMLLLISACCKDVMSVFSYA